MSFLQTNKKKPKPKPNSQENGMALNRKDPEKTFIFLDLIFGLSSICKEILNRKVYKIFVK